MKQNLKEKTTSALTKEYIDEHPYIKYCLKKDVINFSALAKIIGKKLNKTKKTSLEAISIASIRYQKELEKTKLKERGIKKIIKNSEIEIKNKIIVIIIEKNISLELLDNIQKTIKTHNDVIYNIEGSSNNLIITREKYLDFLRENFRDKIIREGIGLSLVALKSCVEIESTPGVISYLTSLFYQNDVNIVEFLSCYKDTFFIIKSQDIFKVFDFLEI